MKKILLFMAAALTFGMAAHAQTAFSEDFNSLENGTVPTGWTTYGDGLTNHYTDAFLTDSWCAMQQSMVCITWTEETTPVDRWLVTPQITVPTQNPMLLFDIIGVNYAPGTPYAESLKIMVSTTDNQKSSFSVLNDLGELAEGNNSYAIDLSSYADQSVYLAFACYTADGVYIFLDNVAVQTVPANSISAVSATVSSNTAQNSTVDVSLTVRNQGSAALTSFDVTYTVNGSDEQTVNVTGINVASFANYTYTLPVQMTTLGANTINITVSNPNNDTDPDNSDNSTSCSTNVYDPSTTTQRTVVMEHFTTARCPNCPSGHERIGAAYQSVQDRVIWIAHHVGYYTDNMTINESNQMLTFFNDGGSTFAPAWMLDRSYDNVNDKSEYPGPAFFPDGTESTVLNNALARPAFATVNISNMTYDPQSRQLSVTVSGEFLQSIAFDSPRLSLYIMQDGIWGTQSGANGSYEHNHVIRACISDVWGDTDPFESTTPAAGDTYTKTFNYTLPTSFTANHCWLAAFVSNYSSDVMNCAILNGAKTGYLMEGDDPTTGIADVESSINVTTYPNPATEMVYVTVEGRINSYTMVDALGRQVMADENTNADILELNVSTLPQGLYMITVTTDRGMATQRVNIVR